MSGSLVTFSGIDSSGKSTQIENLQDYYRGHGISFALRWSRGGYTPGINLLKKAIRLSPKEIIPTPGDFEKNNEQVKRPIISKIWLNISILDLILYYGIWFRLLLLKYNVVIADRYIWDSLIDFKLKFSQYNIENMLLWKLLSKINKRPEKSIMLTLNADESLARSIKKKEPFMESLYIRQARINHYLLFIEQNKWGHVVDGHQSIDDVFLTICDVLNIPSPNK